MGQVKIDDFETRFSGSLSEVGHPNAKMLGHGFEGARIVKWCNDCRDVWPGEYKIDNELWKSVVPEPLCYLCPSCLNERVKASRGYELTGDDFPESPINKLFHFAYRLGRSAA